MLICITLLALAQCQSLYRPQKCRFGLLVNEAILENMLLSDLLSRAVVVDCANRKTHSTSMRFLDKLVPLILSYPFFILLISGIAQLALGIL